MNYILLNDTSHTLNVGCQGTCRALKYLYFKNGHKLLHSYPLGFATEYFIPSFNTRKKKLSYTTWKETTEKLSHKLKPIFKDVDFVLINGEGTLHHNRLATASLLGLTRAIQLMGIPTALVNCTIQDLPENLLETVNDCNYLAIRDALSFQYIKNKGINCIQSSDSIFLADTEKIVGPQNLIGFSPGVNALTESPKRIVRRFQNTVTQDRDTAYITIESEDVALEAFFEPFASKIFPLGSITINNVAELFAHCKAIVSGRYHLGILAWMHRVPVTFLESNSWKIDGLLRLAGLNPEPAIIPEISTMENLRKLALNNVYL
ncbi:polysaccharide pyruvyl transferase family protein [Puniceicoccaceae bacterium K14]|nr:polysaccharide pyruvyl transferase family protein [Puniceicoccaceae bacterium K14]